MSRRSPSNPGGQAHCDVAIVGGGLIGAAIAWRAATAGMTVVLADPEPGGGASHAAAGMLAPVTEVNPLHDPVEQALLRLNLRSARDYPDFVAELADLTGVDPGYRDCGTLTVAHDADDRRALAELFEFQRLMDLDVEWLSGRECRTLEPLLSPSVAAGVRVAGDHQIDNRMLLQALRVATELSSVVWHRQRVIRLLTKHGAVCGVELADGQLVHAGQVVIAAGCHSERVEGLPPGTLPTIRPIKGQILRLRLPTEGPPMLSRTLRGLVNGAHPYLVPRRHGELVLGATTEDLGFDTDPTAGGVYELLRDARALFPMVTELPLVEVGVGLRPTAPDNAPVIGLTAVPGLIVATAHYRNGVLLTPVTAAAITRLLATGRTPTEIEPFSPSRFRAARGAEGERRTTTPTA